MICCATLINSSFLLYYIRDIPWQTRHQLITENIRLRWRKVTKCYKEQVKMKKKELQPWVMVVTIFAYVLGQYFPLYLQTFVEIRNQKHTSRNDPTRKIHYLLLFFSYIHWHIAMHPSFQALIKKQEISIPHTVITDLSMRQHLYPGFNLKVDQSL